MNTKSYLLFEKNREQAVIRKQHGGNDKQQHGGINQKNMAA